MINIEDLAQELKEIHKKIEDLQTNTSINNLTIPTDGKLVVPVVSSDPVSPVEGQIWFNTTSNKYKGYDGTSVVELH